MYYGGESNVPGAPGNLMAAGIPVGQDPRFPMSQESFEQYVDERRLKRRLEPYGGDLFKFLRERNLMNNNVSLPGTPGNLAGIQNAQFFGGPQMGQMPTGFSNKTIS